MSEDRAIRRRYAPGGLGRRVARTRFSNTTGRVQTKADSTMRVFAQVARPGLRPFIDRFLVVESFGLRRDAHLPDIRPVAAFSFRGECRLDGGRRVPAAAFTGLHGTLRAHEHAGGHAVLLATFTPAGAAAFLRPSQEAFSGTTTDLAGLLGRPEELDRLHERLAASPNHGRRIALLEDFLLGRLRLAAPDPLVTAAVNWLEAESGHKRIDELTRYIGLSQSALERRFRRVVGVSPKAFASLVRLRRAVRLRNAGADFAAVAHGAGYFDQAHFINAFRRVAGCTPAAFFPRATANE